MFDRIRKLTKGRCFLCRMPFSTTDVHKWVYSSAGTWNKYCKSCFSGVPQNKIKTRNGTVKTRSHAKKLAKTNSTKKGI